jgi:beta-N-acetylhexosaminidase
MNDTLSFDIETVLAALSPEQRVGQMMAAGFDGLEAPGYILDWLRAGRLGTVILFARNVAGPAQLADLTASLHEASPLPLLIAIDQEGGIVARMRAPFTESPGNMALGAAGDPDLARRMAGVLAAEMRAVGINWNLAPVVDVMSNPANPAIGVRSYGSDPAKVGLLVAAQIQGYQAAGVAACAKHFPGHGNTAIDSHLDLPVIASDRARLDAVDLPPFRAAIAAGVSSVMAAHIRFPTLDPLNPSTLSRAVLHDLLRGELGFEGVLTTDCMEMRAISDRYGTGESAVLAALAGVDVIFFSHTAEKQAAAHDGVLKAVYSGHISTDRITEAARRILTLKARYAGAPQPFASELIATPEHRAVAQEAARAGVVMVRQETGVLPLRPGDGRRVVMVEFASYLDSEALERGGQTGLAERLKERLAGLEAIALESNFTPEQAARARAIATGADVLLLAVRSAHLYPPEAQLADLLIADARRVVLVALRNPHDVARFPTCKTALASLGDASPSLDAVVSALLGDYTPSAGLPVPL